MKAVKAAVTFLFLVVLTLFISQSALADSEVSKTDAFVTTDKSAPGSTLNGSLTIYYEPLPNFCGSFIHKYQESSSL